MIQIKNLESDNFELSSKEKDLVKGGAIGFVGGVAAGTWNTGVNAWFNPQGTNWGQFFTSTLGTIGISTGIGAAFGGPKGAALSA
jgi:hypothetical protein